MVRTVYFLVRSRERGLDSCDDKLSFLWEDMLFKDNFPGFWSIQDISCYMKLFFLCYVIQEYPSILSDGHIFVDREISLSLFDNHWVGTALELEEDFSEVKLRKQDGNLNFQNIKMSGTRNVDEKLRHSFE